MSAGGSVLIHYTILYTYTDARYTNLAYLPCLRSASHEVKHLRWIQQLLQLPQHLHSLHTSSARQISKYTRLQPVHYFHLRVMLMNNIFPSYSWLGSYTQVSVRLETTPRRNYTSTAQEPLSWIWDHSILVFATCGRRHLLANTGVWLRTQICSRKYAIKSMRVKSSERATTAGECWLPATYHSIHWTNSTENCSRLSYS